MENGGSVNSEGRRPSERPFWKDPRVMVPALVVVIAAVITPLLTILISREEPTPEATDLPNASPGSSVVVPGRNLDLVSSVTLIKDNITITLRHAVANESRLTIEMPNDLSPGDYLLEFITKGGETVAAGTISVAPPIAVQPPPVPVTPGPGPVETPPTITPTSTLPTQQNTFIFEREVGHNVIDPDGKRWEKFQTGESVPGIYLSLNFDHLGDFMFLRLDQTLFGEVGGKLVNGSWERLGDKMTLTWAVRTS